MKKLCALTLALVFSTLTGCDRKKDAGEKTYALVPNGPASFWEICRKGGNDAGKELGVRVEFPIPSSANDQKDKIEDLLSKGVDGMSVSIIDPENQTGLLNEAAKRTNLITMDTDAPESARKVYVGVNNYDAGWMAGELVRECQPEGGKVILFIGNMTQDNAKLRRQGTIDCLLGRSKDSSRFDPPGEVLEGGGYEILATLTDLFDYPKAKQNAADMLTKHPDVDVMVGLFAYNVPMIIEELEQAGKLNQIKVVSFDEDEKTLTGIREGTVYGTVVQNPYEYGKRSIEILHALSQGDTSVIPESGFIDIPARKIKADNLEAFWTDLNAKLDK